MNTTRLVAIFPLLSLFACSMPPGAPLPQPARRDPGSSVPFDKVWQIGTHNSFWAEKQGGDPYASGPQERILDQLLADRARSIELDIHRGPTPHTFRVYHVVPGDTLCDTLPECLAIVRTFHRTLPEHHPLIIFLELKELFTGLFDANYTPEDLDHILETELGPLLYRPADFMAPCGTFASTLSRCERLVGWPSVAELKGRVLVSMLGNWDMFGGQNSVDFATYAAPDDIRSRAGFPMISSWKIDWSRLDEHVQERVAVQVLQLAYDQSLFLQALGPGDKVAFAPAQAGRIIRMDKAFSVAEQESVVARQVQVVQTDTPWISYGAPDIDLTLRPLLPSTDVNLLREPGNRLLLAQQGRDSRELVFAYQEVADASTTEWQTVVSVGVAPQRVGCLRAASDLTAGSQSSAMLCRHLLPVALGRDSGGQVLRLTVCQSNSCITLEYPSADGTLGGSGELIAMTVTPLGGQSCVTMKSARLVDKTLDPVWTPLGLEHCLPGALRYQGLARLGVPAGSPLEPVYFFDTRRDGKPIFATDLVTR